MWGILATLGPVGEDGSLPLPDASYAHQAFTKRNLSEAHTKHVVLMSKNNQRYLSSFYSADQPVDKPSVR